MTEGIHAGHRERMRKKLIGFGSEIFTDHELLEMLLYSVIPYKNTNPIAINLIKRFSGLGGVLSASREELMSVDGIGERAADMILAVGAMTIDGEPFDPDSELCRALDDYGEVCRFLLERFDGHPDYKTSLLLLNNSMGYIDFVDMTGTDYSSAAVRARDFLDVAIKRGASVCITAHNHPFGPDIPTVGDLETNAMLKRAFSSAGIELIEHFLIVGNKCIGIMKHSEKEYSPLTATSRFIMSKEGGL